MSGWLALVLLLLLGLGLLRLLGVRGAFLQICGAALMFGAAAYAIQGRPDLAGAPHAASRQAAPIPLTTLRHAFFGRFTPTEHWQLMAESYARRGETADAVSVLRSAVREHPGDPALWVALGNALADHAGMLTPASQLAYERAAELAPGHPAPRFFFGLALARSGERATALALWRSVLAEAPADADWRPFVEDAAAAIGGGAPSRPGPSAPAADRSVSTPPPSTDADRIPPRPPR